MRVSIVRRSCWVGCSFVMLLFACSLGACSSGGHESVNQNGGGGGAAGKGGGGSGGQVAGSAGTWTASGGTDLIEPGGNAGAQDMDATTRPVAVWPPPGYTNVTDTTVGGYALGPELSAGGGTGGSGGGTGGSGGGTSPDACGGLFAVVRDFKLGNRTGGHPDFETKMGDDRGIVETTLGSDSKPVYAGASRTPTTTGKANFDQWYQDIDGVNRTFVLGLHFVDNGGLLTFQADEFFPLDGQGFGAEGQKHNFAFTTEIHTSFLYNGGETFTFIGDDDVFAFINGQLVIDLGGVHNAETAKVVLDDVAPQLGLTTGNVYDLAVFHAERHTVESHFRVDTSLTFMDCGRLPDGAPIH